MLTNFTSLSRVTAPMAECTDSRPDAAMTTLRRPPARQPLPAETPEAIRAHLVAFARITRARAVRRAAVPEPTIDGATWVGPRVRRQ